MKKVTVIAPECTADLTEKPKLRVAAYCRVSTGTDDQLESLETQIRHYESYIRKNPDWEYAGIYYDEGISGTKKEKRAELMRLISDCENGSIDLIVTKSISRFARNTTDCLELVRNLKSCGIYIYFERENIHTGNTDDELMLTILSGMAEEESKSIASNNRWSVKRRFQNGTYKISCPPYGYDTEDGNLVVNREEAEVVRYVFSEILSGKGSKKIADTLNAMGLSNKKGRPWKGSAILGMARNEKYVGDVLFQKTYTDENFNHRRNNGEREQYLFQNNHEPIVTREVFDAAQAAIAQRAREKGTDKSSGKSRNSYQFSGKIICGHCGGTFKRRVHASGKHRIAWCCTTHLADTDKCPVKYIPETSLETAFVTMMNKLIFGHQAVLKPLLSGLRGMNSDAGIKKIGEFEKRLEEIAEQRKVLVGLLSKGYLEPAVYNKGNNELLQEAERIQKQKVSLMRFLSSDSRNLSEVSALLNFVSKADMLTAFDGELFTRFTERIHVYSRTEIGFELKCNLILKERLVF